MTAPKDKDYFSPKNVAKAIGVSESSLKRWCDRGLINFAKTAGGHRRIEKAEILRFSLTKNHLIIKPEAIGLPDRIDLRFESQNQLIENLVAGLVAGDEQICRQILVSQFLGGQSASLIFDEIIRPAFEVIGKRWDCHELDVYQERLGCQIMINVTRELRSLIPSAPENALSAVGGTLSGDHYDLPTLGIEIALMSNGWKARSLGTNLPVDSMIKAMNDLRPKIAWLSISVAKDPQRVVEDVNRLNASIPPSTSLVIGGRAITPEMKSQMSFTAYNETIQSLIDFIQPLNRVHQIMLASRAEAEKQE